MDALKNSETRPSQQERLKVASYIEWYFDNDISEPTMKLLMKNQIKNIGMDVMIDSYMEIVELYRKLIEYIRGGVSAVEMESYVIAKAKKQGDSDSVPAQTLKIHMIDKLSSIDSVYCKRTGKDVNEGEFIEAVRFLGIFKKYYDLSRKHGERTHEL